MFGITISRSKNVFCDNWELFNNCYTKEYIINNKNDPIDYNWNIEAVVAKTISLDKEYSGTNLSYVLTNIMGS